MPRVSDAHRAARREQIAEAALQVLSRYGSETSIAQIVAECGLSAGAIYGNFENKAELARYIAGQLLHRRIGTLDDAVADGQVRTPAEVLRLFMGLHRQPKDLSVLLQFWGEATVDPDLLLGGPGNDTIDGATGEAAVAHHQRSDVCAVPAAGIVAEAMVALVLADAVLEKFGGDSVAETRRNAQSFLDTLRYR